MGKTAIFLTNGTKIKILKSLIFTLYLQHLLIKMNIDYEEH
ncbi:hypothetical protein C7H62_1123 [Mesoflavibacter sp. HG96]|nr:hypothetical protein C7H62_1123 [Mesoflavibacter sp. HG96]QIJ91660.1 hypothetical protein C7H56_1123 [Mesoflavibacter sp. HG37]